MITRYAFLSPLKLIGNYYLLMFLHGLFLGLLFFLRIEARYEEGLFASVKSHINASLDADDTRDSIAVKAMHYCHGIISGGAASFSNADLGPEFSLFHSPALDLITGRGACGSYSLALARILTSYSYPVRIAQMKVGKIYGGHNVVEVQTETGWVVLDPTYDLYFIRPNIRLASFADVQQNWAFYSKAVPPDYKPRYRYEGVRYTNWSKIPVLSPLAKLLLNACLGVHRADQVCMRTHFLKVYNSWSYLLLLLYIPVGLITLKKLLPVKKHKRLVSLPYNPTGIEVHSYDISEQDRTGRKVNEAS